MNEFLTILSAMMFAGTPLLIAGLGLLLNERVGVLNLGAEGLMLLGAMAGFVGAFWTGSILFGLLFGAFAAALLAALFGVLVIFFMTNQYATGLAVMLFGTGLSAFLGSGFVQERLDVAQSAFIDNVRNMAAVLLTAGVAYFFYRTRWGLVMRAVGESPESAYAIGYPVRAIRMAAVVAGGALCGVAGAFLSIISSSGWSEGMTAGKGWIALALIAFATWRPWRILFGAYLFGGVGILQLQMQAKGVYFVNSFVMSMLPYIATILVLVLISHQPGWIRANMPASLGKSFLPGH